MRQTSLFPSQQRAVHGGVLQKGRRKTLRPLARRRPIHFVLKSTRHDLYRRNREIIQSELRRVSEKFHLQVYDLAINHNHCHFIARIPGRKAYIGFIRALTGILARKLGAGLWRVLPFSRVLAWGRDYKQMREYLRKNREETAGIRAYEPRRSWVKRHLSPG